MMRLVVSVCAAGLIIFDPRAVLTQSGAPANPSALRTAWGEPSLAGVWAAATPNATPGRDTFNLGQLERLYKPEARAQMQKLTAKDDPALKCVPQAFPRAALLGQPIQIVQGPGVMVVMMEAFHGFRTIAT